MTIEKNSSICPVQHQNMAILTILGVNVEVSFLNTFLTLISLTLAGSAASSVVESSEDLREYWPVQFMPDDRAAALPSPARDTGSAMMQ